MRRLLLIAAALGASLGIACSTADFTPATPKDCRKVQCDCEEDPGQPTCVGIPGAPEGGLEGGNTIDAPVLDAQVEDAPEGDASDDAADAADQ